MDAVASKPADVRGVATRDALLDAAEALIADHGFKEPSHRMIAHEAGAHAALVGYHFGTKEMLFEAAVERRAERLVQAWRAALDRVCRDPDRTVEDVLHSWWEPFGGLHLQQDLPWRNYLCTVARLASAKDGNDWYQRYFGTVDRDFQRELGEILPTKEQDGVDACFRYARTLFGEVLLHRCGKVGGECVPRGFRENDTNRLIGFVADGMRGLARKVWAAAD
ncbi:MAG: TetR/AcrR family transcriptional regulator [Casimicrobiaceae bacterium]